jgi:hypothetical protein
MAVARSSSMTASQPSIASLLIGVYLVGYVGMSTVDQLSTLRYVMYLGPLILLAAPLISDGTSVQGKALNLLFVYIFLGGLGWLLSPGISEHFLRDYIIIASILVCFAIAPYVREGHIRFAFYASFVLFAFRYTLTDHGGFSLQFLRSASLSQSYDSNEGLLGAIYVIYFFAIGARRDTILALIMTFLGGKRIGLAAMLAGVLVIWFLLKSPALNRPKARFFLLLLAFAAINAVSVYLVWIAETAFRAAHITVPIEEFFAGRYMISNAIYDEMSARSILTSLFGSGAGSADTVTLEITAGRTPLTHNDWLKIMFDYGVIGSVVFTVGFAAIFSTSALAMGLGLATAVLMMTDNVLIYLFYQIPVALMIAYALSWRPLNRPS